MKIKKWNQENLQKIGIHDTGNGTMIIVSQEEAMLLIRCLSNQILDKAGSPLGRKEFFDDKGEYFSIVVESDITDDTNYMPCPNCNGFLIFEPEEDEENSFDKFICIGLKNKPPCNQIFVLHKSKGRKI